MFASQDVHLLSCSNFDRNMSAAAASPPPQGNTLQQDLITGFNKLPGGSTFTPKIIIYDTELDCAVTVTGSKSGMLCVVDLEEMLSDIRKKHSLFRVRDVSFLFDKDTKKQELLPTIIRVTGWHKPIMTNPVPDPLCESMQLLLMMPPTPTPKETDDPKTVYKRKGNVKEKEDDDKTWTSKKRQKTSTEIPWNHFLNTPSLVIEINRCMSSTNVTSFTYKELLRPIVMCLCSLHGTSTPVDVKCALIENPRKASGEFQCGLFVTGYTLLSRNMLMSLETEIKNYLIRQTGSVQVHVLTRIALLKHALDLSLSW